MRIESNSIEDYISKCPAERQEALKKLIKVIRENLPEGFNEQLSYGMPGWVVPHTLYPSGYHCDPKLPLPFLSMASQKNFIAVYHMGIYADEELMKWFLAEYPKHSTKKLDMGKSCLRFKKVEDIPYELIGQLVSKMSTQDWINCYESKFRS